MQDAGMSPYGIFFFFEFLIIPHVADVVHPVPLLFQERYRRYSENLVSPLKWKVFLIDHRPSPKC